MSKSKIGFIGVGLMGHGAAKNILERGGTRSPSLATGTGSPSTISSGAARARLRPEDIAQSSDIVILCLPSAVEVDAAFNGEDGLMQAVRPGMIFVDATTSDPAATRSSAPLSSGRVLL